MTVCRFILRNFTEIECIMKYLLISAGMIFLSCNNTNNQLEVLGEPDKDELSGIEIAKGSRHIWGIEDHGNDNKLYAFDETAKTVGTITVANAKNNDWEDIASDSSGNLYIGDFGNNDNDRKDLAILKIDGKTLDSSSVAVSAVTKFYYPEQKDFPPKKSEWFYDVEAFYEHEGHFYLFTKNRSSGFNGNFSVYKVPNKHGNFAAQKIGELNTCGKYSKCAIAGADISPDGKTVVLLAADRLWLVTGFTGDDFSIATMEMYELGHNTEKEGICFKDDDTLLIVDEKEKKTGGKLYRLSIAALKGKPEAK